jgi:hypothetical protein
MSNICFHVSEESWEIGGVRPLSDMSLLKSLSYVINKKVTEFFRNPQSYQESKKGVGMIRDQGAIALWTKRASKKKEARKE